MSDPTFEGIAVEHEESQYTPDVATDWPWFNLKSFTVEHENSQYTPSVAVDWPWFNFKGIVIEIPMGADNDEFPLTSPDPRPFGSHPTNWRG